MDLNLFDRSRLTPSRIAGIYLVFGLVALAFSDLLLPALYEDPLLGRLQAAKGAVEVFTTAGLIFLLVRWSFADLRLYQRAIDAAPIGVTVTDPTQDDNPLVFANDQFEALTGYEEASIRGQNCRFLQGPETADPTRRQLREAIDAEEPVSVDIVNYRQDGAKFWNKVDVAPVTNGNGEVTHFVGFQSDITERKIREERLRVLNRILRHNVRNKMTVIGGHVQMLRAEFDEPPDSMGTIQSAVTEIQSLTETVRKSEAVLQAAMESEGPIALDEQLRLLVHGFRDRYTEATFELSLPEGSVRVSDAGLVRAIEEAVDNAVRHNDDPEPTVEVCVERDADDWLTVTIADNGPGIPATEVEVLQEGETPLKHANRLGIWAIHWIVNLTGGTLDIGESDLGGTVLTMCVPSADA